MELGDQRVDRRLDGRAQPLPGLEALPLDPVDGEPGREPVELPCQLDRVGDAERVGGRPEDLGGQRRVGRVEAMEVARARRPR